jgi:hypothetical protein
LKDWLQRFSSLLFLILLAVMFASFRDMNRAEASGQQDWYAQSRFKFYISTINLTLLFVLWNTYKLMNENRKLSKYERWAAVAQFLPGAKDHLERLSQMDNKSNTTSPGPSVTAKDD